MKVRIEVPNGSDQPDNTYADLDAIPSVGDKLEFVRFDGHCTVKAVIWKLDAKDAGDDHDVLVLADPPPTVRVIV